MKVLLILLVIVLGVYCITQKTTPKMAFLRFRLYAKLLLIRLHIL